jgi:hypothetical protein
MQTRFKNLFSLSLLLNSKMNLFKNSYTIDKQLKKPKQLFYTQIQT